MRSTLVLLVLCFSSPLLVAQIQAPADPAQKKARWIQEAGWAPPASIDDLIARAAAVARVRFVSSRVIGIERAAGNPNVATEHTVEIVQVYKTNADHPLPVRQAVNILQTAGVLELDDKIIEVADEHPIPAGTEAVVFLRWNDVAKRYHLVGPHGTFFVVKGRIQPAADWWEVALNRTGVTLEHFCREISRKALVRQ